MLLHFQCLCVKLRILRLSRSTFLTRTVSYVLPHSRDISDFLRVVNSANENKIRKAPPWRVMFFGTDEFAVESLKILTESRNPSAGKVVDTIDIVTLPVISSKEVPVRRFARQHHLLIHDWPLQWPCKHFDVGVVVSFGCLLKEELICRFPYGILNVHPSLLPRWRGPAPVFHSVLHDDAVTGVTIMQIRPKRFDVGPVLMQKEFVVPARYTSEELGADLSKLGAEMLISTLKTLPEMIQNQKEQANYGATLAPKINTAMSWINWEEQTCYQIDCLYRAIGYKILLRTLWQGEVIKLMDLVKEEDIPKLSDLELKRTQIPGSFLFHKISNILLVRCKDGLVGFTAVKLKKRLSAADFYNGYLHQSSVTRSGIPQEKWLFKTFKKQHKKDKDANFFIHSYNHGRVKNK
ncbi:methionyl-tRNA formyltransferase, mitochondrial isoform X1 [Erpetoichthys calabaricus]|uniref:Methionyl-tRNA formyltransferase, mitochondrial n=1 Tax=Erpetoichthys calabaricus TaxID=27687 RepID=A0A8C4TIB2_ERPCA|nr:methionyl-tRNA formyltransferase, mitochondrial isoform X1 [Erpetoichthys calabaricus]